MLPQISCSPAASVQERRVTYQQHPQHSILVDRGAGNLGLGPQALVCGAFAPLDSAKHGTMLSFDLLHNPVHVGMQGLTELM